MGNKLVLLGHGVGIKLTIESLLANKKLGFEVAGIVTHPYEDHIHDLELINKRARLYGEYAYNVFNSKADYDIPLYEAKDINSKEVVDWIDRINPSYIISIGCRNIIKKPFLKKFKNRVLNVHTTPLPKYRGAASDSWMILNGEWGKQQYGCVHYINEGLDTGNIIAKSYYTVPEFAFPIDVFKARMDIFKDVVAKALNKLETQTEYEGENQDNDKATVFPRLFTPQDGKINWEYEGRDLIKFIYAFGYPHEGANCFFNKQKINILKAIFFSDFKFHPFAIGLIFGKDKMNNYKVAVKGGYLLLTTVEIDGSEIKQNTIFRLGKYLS